MRLSYRQGIINAQTNFLQVSLSGVSLLSIGTMFSATVSHGTSEYLIKEFQTVNNAWVGTFNVDTWLYVDINRVTAIKTFGTTSLLPIFSTVAPNAPLNDQHWFDTTQNKMKVYNSSANAWLVVIRLFVGKLTAGTIPSYVYPIGGTQAGTINSDGIASGTIVFDRSLSPIIKGNGEFYTTEDELIVDGFAQYVRLESNVIPITSNANISAYSVVKFVSDGVVGLCNYNDIGNSVLGMISENLTYGQSGAMMVQGIIVNPNWVINNWAVNSSLWVLENGELVDVDPYASNPSLYPIKRVPVARVISKNTIIFEQGLGGIGQTGATGASDVDPATDVAFGTVKLTSNTASSVVVSTDDTRLVPGNTLAAVNHTHSASTITSVPSGFISGANVQAAIAQIATDVVLKSGSVMSGTLDLDSNPIINLPSPVNLLDGANKAYVDSKVSGLNWKDPIHMANLISDAAVTPPGSPNFSDVYIVPSAGVGAWGFPAGSIVHWTGTAWVAEPDGVLSAHPVGTRFGISIESPTVAGGSFAGKDAKIAVLTNPSLPIWSFITPILNDAVLVNNVDSQHAYHQYVFNGTDWVEFGGPQAFTIGTGLELNGNSLQVDDTRYVNVTGDTMTGDLIISGSNQLGVSKTSLDVFDSYYSTIQLGPANSLVTGYNGGVAEDWLEFDLCVNTVFDSLGTKNIAAGNSSYLYLDSGYIGFLATTTTALAGSQINGNFANVFSSTFSGTFFNSGISSRGTFVAQSKYIPSSKLEYNPDANVSYGPMRMTTPGDSIIELRDITNNVDMYVGTNSYGGILGTITNHPMTFRTNSTERMRIDANGHLMVNQYSTSDTVEFVAYTGTHALRLTGAANNFTEIITGDSTVGQSYGLFIQAGTNTSDYAFSVNNYSQSINIISAKGDGTVGIGTSFPNERLTVNGVVSLAHTASTPSLSAGFGKLWVDNTSGELQFTKYDGTVQPITPTPYDVVGYVEGSPTSNATVLFFLAIRNFTLSTSYGTPRCESMTAATSSATFTIKKNGSSIGTMVFSASGTVAVVSLTTTSVVVGDKITITAPVSADATLANIAFTLPAILS